MTKVVEKIRKEATLKINDGWHIGSDNPIFSANSIDVSFSKIRLPKIIPVVCMMA